MRAARIAAVTAGLAATGAVVGALVGVLMMTFWLVPGELPHLWADRDFFRAGASLGAMMGAVLGPVAAWLLMRHVPLGRAVGGTALGTLGAAALGLAAGGQGASLEAAFLGFGGVAVYLCVRTPRRERRIAAGIPAAPPAD